MSDNQSGTPEAASSADKTSSESQPIPARRTGLKWMNGILLLLYGYGFGGNVFDENFSRKGIVWMVSMFLLGSALVVSSFCGFLAALNPAGQIRRSLAKWSNMIVLVIPLVILVRAILTGGTVQYGFILSALVGLPAILNLRAFWKPPEK